MAKFGHAGLDAALDDDHSTLHWAAILAVAVLPALAAALIIGWRWFRQNASEIAENVSRLINRVGASPACRSFVSDIRGRGLLS